jgi:glucan phosphoethanolaminetransferase (alkaline phosphatase superfamily)
MIQYKYMEEEDHFTQTLLSALIDALAAAAIAALSFSLFSYTHSPLSLSLILLSNNASIYRYFMADNRPSIMAQMVATHGLHHFCQWWGQLPL